MVLKRHKNDNYQLYETNYFIIYDGFAVRR